MPKSKCAWREECTAEGNPPAEGEKCDEPCPSCHPRFNRLHETDYGFTYEKADGMIAECCFSLFLIGEAMSKDCDFEEEADGFGPGEGTHGDWSAIRDSSHEAIDVMLQKALNHLFGDNHTFGGN
jgi:hypothetical protein